MSYKPLESSVSVASLQQRIRALEASQRDAQLENEELRSSNERLRAERRMLHEGEEQERSTGREREKQFSEERVCVRPPSVADCSLS